jgi:hypothetical protein
MDLLPCPFNLQQVRVVAPFLTFSLEASPVSLLEMARDNNHDKRPWGGDPSHGAQSPPPHRMRIAAGHNRALLLGRMGTSEHR